MNENYRFITGTLYELQGASYIAVWTNAFDNTKAKAIKSYEDSIANGT